MAQPAKARASLPLLPSHDPATSPPPAGLEQLGSRVAEVRAKLQERIAALMRRQEEMLGAQAEMQAALAGVGRDVEHTRGQVGQVRAGGESGRQRVQGVLVQGSV